MTGRDQGSEIRDQETEGMKQLLREALPPLGRDREPDRDLWPAMLQRMDEQSSRAAASVPWFDWALAGGLVAFVSIAPRTIPVILYYL
ncbi:MAG TPA: hypothetical protein VKB47_01305 [Terracidiphilus sp.]|nr:hypothetical protein [Terracidiphilus sp.]